MTDSIQIAGDLETVEKTLTMLLEAVKVARSNPKNTCLPQVSLPPRNEEPSPPPSELTIERVKTVLAAVQRKEGGREWLKELLEHYGATRLSEVKSEFYGSVLEEAQEWLDPIPF